MISSLTYFNNNIYLFLDDYHKYIVYYILNNYNYLNLKQNIIRDKWFSFYLFFRLYPKTRNICQASKNELFKNCSIYTVLISSQVIVIG